MRASFISNKRDGFTENLTNGQDLDDADSVSQGFDYEPSDTFQQTSWHKCFMKIETVLPKNY